MSENNEQNGGLFSDEYEAPKRENPYLKKNREKAKAEKSKREKTVSEVDSPHGTIASEDKPVRGSSAPGYATSEVSYVHKRTFSDWMFEHVKLIATIATVIVVLSLVLITDVVDIVENVITQVQQGDKEDLTLNYVKGLSEMGDSITWQHLDKFKRNETKVQDSVTWKIPVEGTDYVLWISGVSTDKPPVYVYLYDGDGDRLVLGEEDFDAFIESHSK